MTVEFALVSIPLFLFLFASVEFGRAMMCVQAMEEAARAGCRLSVIQGATTTEVETEVDSIMQVAGISNYAVDITPNFADLERYEPISVTVTASFDDMSWLPSPRFVAGMSFTGSCVLPKEGSPDDG